MQLIATCFAGPKRSRLAARLAPGINIACSISHTRVILSAPLLTSLHISRDILDPDAFDVNIIVKAKEKKYNGGMFEQSSEWYALDNKLIKIDLNVLKKILVISLKNSVKNIFEMRNGDF